MTRVAITTDRFGVAAPHFTSVGLEPVSIPCIRLEPASPEDLAQARSDAGDAELVIISSPRTVELLWPDGGMPKIDVAAVGRATEAAAESAGGLVVVTGDGGLLDLAAACRGRLAEGRVLLLHASGTDPVALQRLRTLAPDLVERVVYTVRPVAAAPTPVDAVAFGSPSAVEGWLLTRRLDLVVGAIGKTTAAAVARRRPPDVIASRPSYYALARAIRSFLEVKV